MRFDIFIFELRKYRVFNLPKFNSFTQNCHYNCCNDVEQKNRMHDLWIYSILVIFTGTLIRQHKKSSYCKEYRS